MSKKEMYEVKQEELNEVAGGRPDIRMAAPLALEEIENRPDLVAELKNALASDRLTEARELTLLAADRLKAVAMEKFGLALSDEAVTALIDKTKGLI